VRYDPIWGDRLHRVKIVEVVKQYKKSERKPNTANWQRTGTQELATPRTRPQNYRS